MLVYNIVMDARTCLEVVQAAEHGTGRASEVELKRVSPGSRAVDSESRMYFDHEPV